MFCLCSGAALPWTLRICKSCVVAVTFRRQNERINVGARRLLHGKSLWKIYKSDLWIYGIMLLWMVRFITGVYPGIGPSFTRWLKM